ncbi:sensor histidine kinase [Bacillus luteolus]|uniref:histidine kinase n=1 Tax=Litchfieldia luteola TaxID=682179 RepID=A0ABR9QE97_9BACI|nr:sensor histidine kinase [Cytobacillus luteolus]MBE4906814.1 sensor histidine kinase [Cytobacillus luteolus]MBP1940532.1 NarL family two-component system sensor histidine kinase LiaS [Cytobacillus luteolus]
MFSNLNSIRLTMIRSHVISALMVGILFFTGLQLILLALPKNPLALSTILLLTAFVFVISVGSGIYFGYRDSTDVKKRLEEVSTFITILERGNLKTRVDVDGQDEIARITQSLNQLSAKIEKQVQSLQRLADEKTELAEEAHKAASIEERQRIARDLHDAVSQQLFAVSMMSSAAVRLLDSKPEKVKEIIGQVSELAAQAQVEMRALLLHLRPVHLGRDSLYEGLVKLIEELQSKCSLHFETAIDQIDCLSKGTEDHLFRIIQEALSNILRHSDATQVKLTFSQKEEYVFLQIYDNGKGFDVSEDKKISYGLKTMRERCEEIGGVFKLHSKQDEGTYITIRVSV